MMGIIEGKKLVNNKENEEISRKIIEFFVQKMGEMNEHSKENFFLILNSEDPSFSLPNMMGEIAFLLEKEKEHPSFLKGLNIENFVITSYLAERVIKTLRGVYC